MQRTKDQLINLAENDERMAESCAETKADFEAEVKTYDARAKHHLARAKEYRKAAALLPDAESDPAIMEGRF